MKYLILTALMAMLSTTVLAQGTPDGVTPANENICSELQGGTPSLYGLCVAFCEAQDVFDENTPLTQDAIDAIVAENVSASKILKKYNDRRDENDPTMPCVTVQEDECPCFTEENIAANMANPQYSQNGSATFLRDLNGTGLFATFLGRSGETSCRGRFFDENNVLVNQQLQVTPEEFVTCTNAINAYAPQ